MLLLRKHRMATYLPWSHAHLKWGHGPCHDSAQGMGLGKQFDNKTM